MYSQNSGGTISLLSKANSAARFRSSSVFLLLGSLSAMRFVAAVQEREKDGDKKVEQVSRELWKRIWSEDKDITEPASLSEVPAYQAWSCLRRLRSTV